MALASQNKTLRLMASKLGLAAEDKVLRKAAEFERLLHTKTIAGSNMSDTSKVIICLDLAASLFGVDMDTKVAVKFSGLKPSSYTSNRKVVENLLELNSDKLTVAAVCIKLQCSGVQALAENILDGYQKHAKLEIDLNLPQYVCMAVHQACRLKKVKVSKAKLLESSRLRPAQWSKLETDWSKFTDENFASVKAKRGRPVKNTVANDEIEIEKPLKEEASAEPQIEAYEDWKKRILETAYKELKELESQNQQIKQQKIENMEEDRRSPRKHSQSHSPRKNLQLKSPKVQECIIKVSRLSLSKDQLQPTQIIPRSSPRKLNQYLSPTNENQFSTRKDCFLSPMQEDMSPRRSPRKTPQKCSPYTTPSSKAGVRLLFPKNL